ncbi:hypothetical protein O1M63_39380 [Streptomyces mirabilis]|nr:hypothetical protein [Streptomyces mirabilis]
MTVADTRRQERRPGSVWWMRYGLDLVLLIGSWLIFRASSGNQYALVLAPEGVPSISVSYWAFLGPALLWIGAALLLWRLTLLALTYGRPVLTRLARPLASNLAGTTAAVLSRRRRPWPARWCCWRSRCRSRSPRRPSTRRTSSRPRSTRGSPTAPTSRSPNRPARGSRRAGPTR